MFILSVQEKWRITASPFYVRDLQNEVRELGVQDRVHFLGHIPKEDQIDIMKKSLACDSTDTF